MLKYAQIFFLKIFGSEIFLDTSILPPLCIMILALTGGYFSLTETSLQECRHGRIEKLADDGDENAKAVLEILESSHLYLSVARIGIILTAILSGICAVLCVPLISKHLEFMENAEPVSLAISTITTAFTMLLIGEFLPKRAARQVPENFLLKHHKSFSRLVKIISPFVSMLTKIAGGAMLLVGMNTETENTVTEDEVKDLIEQGTKDGTFEKTEQEMVTGIFRLSDQTAYALMTPRTRIVWLDLTDDIRHNLKILKENPHTILPVGYGSLDDCRGVIYAKDILNELLENKNPDEIDLSKLTRKPVYVPRTMETFRLLEKFQTLGVSEAMVLDEYGGVTGFITIDDIFSEIVDTKDSDDSGNSQIVQHDKNSRFVDGLCAIDDFKESFGIESFPYEEEDHYQTMGGFVTSYFGYIPKVGESFEWNGLQFEVTGMDRARVAGILVRRISKNTESKIEVMK